MRASETKTSGLARTGERQVDERLTPGMAVHARGLIHVVPVEGSSHSIIRIDYKPAGTIGLAIINGLVLSIFLIPMVLIGIDFDQVFDAIVLGDSAISEGEAYRSIWDLTLLLPVVTLVIVNFVWLMGNRLRSTRIALADGYILISRGHWSGRRASKYDADRVTGFQVYIDSLSFGQPGNQTQIAVNSEEEAEWLKNRLLAWRLKL